MAYDVLISYSLKDKTAADAMCATLENEGIRCWIAPRDILPGTSYAKAIIDAINKTRIVVLLFSSHSNRSQQVMREVERAVSKGLPIIPFRIEDTPLSEDMEYFISSSHWLDAMTPPLEAHLKQLAGIVSTLLTPASPEGKNTADIVLRLTVHIACFVGSYTPCFFINATNLCRDVDIEITHIWFESNPKVFAANADRPLPKRLRPHETWETWVSLTQFSSEHLHEGLYHLARARLSTGEIISSTKNESVPDEGYVPGGPITEYP